MPTDARPRLDLAMPVHNEGPSIEHTLEEWQAELSVAIDLRFLIAEDGSTDDTKEVLRRLEKRLPMHLDIAAGRRGYGHALKAALLAAETDYVLACDSDGQIDPRDFWSVWAVREQYDLIVGWRVRRADHWFRKLMSGSFKLYHRLLFRTELHDPSCNLMLMKREVAERIVPRLGHLVEGFQWELTARAIQARLKIGEVRLNHRPRASGGSAVFQPARVPGIAYRNVAALLKVFLDNRA
jgi:glycosyltransferase involved in cell wall biosynthesis